MIGIAMYNTINTLWKAGHNKSAIAKLVSHDWKTVHKVIENYKQGIVAPTKKPHPSKLDNYLDKILELLENDLSVVRIHEYLSEQGIDVGYSTVKDYVKKITKDSRQDVCIRFTCEPGEEAQVDFGYSGLQPNKNGKCSKSWVFAMTLSYSRKAYYEVVFDQKVATFINCHINAFKFFKGIPNLVKIDNLKAAVLKANFYSPVYQQQYKDFADYFSFDILPCRVRQPQEKGRVESGVKYVKNNFFKGRTFSSYLELKKSLQQWIDNKCNVRIHGTTKKQPEFLYNKIEFATLQKLPEQEFKLLDVGIRAVYRDCHITYNNNYYSVPYKYVGKEVQVEADSNMLKIRDIVDNSTITIHTICNGAGEFITVDDHYPPYKQINGEKSQKKLQQQISAIGLHCGKLFDIII